MVCRIGVRAGTAALGNAGEANWCRELRNAPRGCFVEACESPSRVGRPLHRRDNNTCKLQGKGWTVMNPTIQPAANRMLSRSEPYFKHSNPRVGESLSESSLAKAAVAAARHWRPFAVSTLRPPAAGWRRACLRACMQDRHKQRAQPTFPSPTATWQHASGRCLPSGRARPWFYLGTFRHCSNETRRGLDRQRWQSINILPTGT